MNELAEYHPLTDMPAMIGPYRPVSPIGQGGMAKVYRAVHPLRQNVSVAIKQILPDHAVHAQFRSAFARELETTAAFRHFNIVRMHEHGVAADGTPYMVMELVEGLDLRTFQRAHAGHRLPPAWVVLIALDLAHALEYVHDTRRAGGAAVLHRDISPQNVLLTPHGDAKLTDFGIAKAVDEQGEATATVAVSGKLMYMSPEQAMGEDLDARADLYSLGLVLFELVAGEPAFPGTGQTKLFARVRAADRASLADIAPAETPPVLIEIIEALLRPDREERTPDASTLVRQLTPLAPAFLERLDLARSVAEYKNRDTGLSLAALSAARSLPSQPPNATMDIQPGDILTAAPRRAKRPPEPAPDVVTDAPTTPKPAPATSVVPQREPSPSKRKLLLAVFAALLVVGIGVGVFLRPAVNASRLPGHLEGPAAALVPPPTAPAPATTAAPTPPPVAAAPSAPPATPAETPRAIEPPPAPSPAPVEGTGPVDSPSPDSSPVSPEVPPPAAPAPVERSRPSAPATPGTVRVVVLPWGNVWADGAAQGQAPQSLTLRPGRHTIAVGQGTQTHRRSVTVRSGETTTVRIDLRE